MFKPVSVLGIDLGSYYIKYIELQSKGKSSVVRSLGFIETPPGAIDQTGILEPLAVGQALRKLLQDNKVQATNAVISISGQASVVVRMMQVPTMPPDALKEHMQWEIQKQSPFIEKAIVSDYYVMEPEDPNALNRDVVVAIAPLMVANMLQSIVNTAGKKLIAIDIEPLAVARSLQTSYGTRFAGQNVCVVEIGHLTTAINVYRNGCLLMPRLLPIGGSEFNRVIAEKMRISHIEAEKLKKEKATIPESLLTPSFGATGGFEVTSTFSPSSVFSGYETTTETTQQGSYTPYAPFGEQVPPSQPESEKKPEASFFEIPSFGEKPTPTSSQQIPAEEPLIPEQDSEVTLLIDAMRFALEEFAEEIRRSMDYLQTQGDKVDQMIICGGGAQIKGLDKYFSAQLGVPCEMYDPFIGVSLHQQVDPGFAIKHAPMFAVAMGNALYTQY